MNTARHNAHMWLYSICMYRLVYFLSKTRIAPEQKHRIGRTYLVNLSWGWGPTNILRLLQMTKTRGSCIPQIKLSFPTWNEPVTSQRNAEAPSDRPRIDTTKPRTWPRASIDTMTHIELTCFGEFETIKIQTNKQI